MSTYPPPMDSNNKKKLIITPAYLEATMNAIEKRSGDLAARRQYLNDKILNMEKTMPLLIAYNVCSGGGGEKDQTNVLNKIRAIVDSVSPLPNSELTESTIKATNEQVNTLKTETTQLHV